MDEEKILIKKAKRYLLAHYWENTIKMSVTGNTVKSGTGVLSVDCTVSVFIIFWSKWHKDFHFKDGKIVEMEYKQK